MNKMEKLTVKMEEMTLEDYQLLKTCKLIYLLLKLFTIYYL